MYGHNAIESCCVCVLLQVVKCISDAKGCNIYINSITFCLCNCVNAEHDVRTVCEATQSPLWWPSLLMCSLVLCLSLLPCFVESSPFSSHLNSENAQELCLIQLMSWRWQRCLWHGCACVTPAYTLSLHLNTLIRLEQIKASADVDELLWAPCHFAFVCPSIRATCSFRTWKYVPCLALQRPAWEVTYRY